jgi:DNA polymerase type B, organellar and viral
LPIEAVYDIETVGWGEHANDPEKGFLCGGLLLGDGSYFYADWRNQDELASRILAVEGAVWAHSGGTFDHKWLLSRTDRRFSLRLAGSRIVEARNGSLRLLDSLAISKLSLADFTRGLGIEKQKHPLLCHSPDVCGPWCEGFCRFRRDMGDADWRAVREYLEADCRSLLEALRRLNEWAEAHDLDLAPTIGSAAWRNASRLLGLGEASLSLPDHLFAREGYQGGRVQCFRPHSGGGVEHDVNALYPSVLARLRVPVGVPTRRAGLSVGEVYRRERPGFFRARVRVPDLFIPPLGKRTRTRTVYPTGTFSGVWCGSELRYAESCGVTILELKECLTWPEEERLFEGWIAKLWALRFNAEGGKSGPFGTFLKFYLNSLTGKFGSKPLRMRYVYKPTATKIEPAWEEIGSGVWGVPCSGVRWSSTQRRLLAGQACSHVEWAAHITAAGRVEWHRQAMAGGGNDAVYGDTDSLFSEGPRTDHVGDGLGEWQRKGIYSDFDSIAPKFYSYRPEGQSAKLEVTDGRQVRSKGVRAAFPEEWRELFATGSHRFAWTSSTGFRMAARSGLSLFGESTISREIKRGYGDRILMPEGITRPPTAKELGLE